MERERNLADEPTCQRMLRVPLSRERIVDAALAYVDRHCLEELSMRKLGAELGVEAMSLYRYHPSKAHLLEEMAARLFEELSVPDPTDGDWKGQLREYARSVRRLARDHPRLFPLILTFGPTLPAVRRIVDAMLAMWREAGFETSLAIHAQRAVVGYVMGATLWELQLDARAVAPGSPEDSDAVALPVLDVGRASRHAPHPRREAAFEFGLEMLLDGLERRLETGAGAGGA